MAEQNQREKEATLTDPTGAINESTLSEPTATEPLQYVSSDSDQSLSDQEDKQKRLELGRSTTAATIASTLTVESASKQKGKRKPWFKRLNPLKRSIKPPIPKERRVSREYGASFLSLLTFQWMAPLMSTGYQRPLELNDIWLVNPNRSSPVLSAKLKESFRKRVARGDKYPLVWAIHETFKFEFWLGGICQLFSSIFQVMSPFTLRYLIAFAADAYIAQHKHSKAPHIANGIGLVIGITLMQMFQSMGTNHFIYRGQMVGAQSRGALINVIFEKAMKLSGRAKAGGRAVNDASVEEEKLNVQNQAEKEHYFKRMINRRLHPQGGPKVAVNQGQEISGDGVGWGNGRVVNLMSTDTYRVDVASGMFHMVWTSPVAIMITLVLLLVNLTYSALAGFALLVIGIPILTKAIKSLFARRRAINKITDQRVSLTQEILQAVRFVKYFGWESSFLDRIDNIRKREIRAIQILLAIRNGINAVSMSLPIFASMLSFITYSLSSHGLNPAYIFSSLALFNSLRMPLNLLPLVIGQVVDAWSSLGRIQDFLIAEEQSDDFIWDYEGKKAISIEQANFTWERTVSQDPDKQHNVQLNKKQIKAAKDADKAASKPNKQERLHNGEDSSSTLTQVEPFKLRDIDITVGRHELVAVIGGVGSGKSSLLAALAGDMRRTNGTVTMGATRAFCPQCELQWSCACLKYIR